MPVDPTSRNAGSTGAAARDDRSAPAKAARGTTKSGNRLGSAADALQVDPASKAITDLAAAIIALADNRDSATRTDYRHPRFKEIVAILKDLHGGT